MKLFVKNVTVCSIATINPQLSKNSGVCIEIEQRDEGPIPHVHFYLDKTRNKRRCAFIRLDVPEYADHHKQKSKTLNNKQRKFFQEYMSEKWPGEYIKSIYTDEIREATCYQAAVKIWVDTYGNTVEFNYDDDGFPVMPNYLTLITK